ncbi:hypothetical protein PybrP1_012731 [[Pythium] brassicae (nom. inval.)]|nr:hypothetical protein PybrP1_012731 [[Pythium] brassicae (nom. inval.)]
MPLLHVVGVAATNQTFSICYCFMKSEREEDYVWALGCWHIEKNVLSNVKRHLTTTARWREFETDWAGVVQALDEETYNNAWNNMREKYGGDGATIAYLEHTWLPYKVMFVLAWTKTRH